MPSRPVGHYKRSGRRRSGSCDALPSVVQIHSQSVHFRGHGEGYHTTLSPRGEYSIIADAKLADEVEAGMKQVDEGDGHARMAQAASHRTSRMSSGSSESGQTRPGQEETGSKDPRQNDGW
jgi:hypothetical protein